jgi:hypothetical protein
LAQRKVSMTRRDGVMMSAGGEATPERGKGEDDATWANTNLIGQKNKENKRNRFN